jgi:hypothetical protein
LGQSELQTGLSPWGKVKRNQFSKRQLYEILAEAVKNTG